MKKVFFYSLSVSLITIVTSFSFSKPKANEVVLKYVKEVMGSQVGRGECSDLMMGAQYKVTQSKAKHSKSKYVIAGDYISFQNVYVNGYSFPQHYGIIIQVKGKKHYVIAHQNHNGNRTVQTLEIDLNDIQSGKYSVQHP